MVAQLLCETFCRLPAVYMAGDHNQLRPKPDCFALEQREYRFDVSAFERIVTAGFRHGLLQTQNRMSSDLADVVRSLQVYDRYLDATSAESKTSPLYLPGAVFWWDHNSVEGVDSGSSEGASRGYHNDAEADRAVAAAAWQMLHGTHASRIAILTPYKGQVTVIRRRLEKLPPVVVDAALAGLPERQDADVVASAVARVAATAMPPRSSLPLSRAIAFAPPSSEIRLPRVCTVDEFQGDEADFIVLSLVRCNSSGKLGFVETVNRVTVALSRARRGLIIVASAKHLLQSSVCARVLAHLDARSLVSEDFPLFCPRHGHVTYARAGSDVPLGSAYPCKRPCGGRLECNDPCLLPCHTLDANHVVATRGCRVPKLHLFPECGHQGQVACCDLQQKRSRPLLCLAPCKVALPCSHLCPNVCSQPCIDAAACPLCLEVHEATRQREMLEAIENRAATVARAKALSDAASATSSSSLRTLSRDEPMFLQVETAALRSVQAAHSFALRVVQIEEVCSSALEQRFFSAVEHLFKPTTRSERLYHGTLYKNVDGILREGFQTRQSRTGPRASHEHHLLGPAIYVCPDSSKAAREEYTGGNGEGALLVCDVLLGSTLRVNRPDRSFGSDAHRKAKKYDSCFVARGDPILFDEFAVYNPACVLPRRVQIIGGKSYFPITTLTANGACCRFVVRFERVGITACLPDDKPISSLSINGSDVKFYSLLAETAKTRTDGVYSHFHVAHSLLRLLEKSSVYPSIELLEVTFCDNPRSTASFEKARRALESREINAEDGVVFHGSDPESLKSIQCNGFRIGGLEGQRVVHGTMHGFGVYTGAAASVAAPYSRKGDGGAEIDLLVVKILRGTRSPNPLSGADCSMDDDDVVKQSFHYYSPVAEPDFVVLSSPALALPIYRVRFRVGVA